jgi:hypothetical protein
MAKIAAALVAIICWAGLAIQFAATYSAQHDLVTTVWILLRFFTIITNLLVAAAMTSIATGGKVSPNILGGLTLAIVLVGIVYATLLEGTVHLRGPAILADTLLHKVSPVAMTLWWLVFSPRRKLAWNAPLGWAIYPVGYFAYALVRGHYEHIFPYPFIDVGKLGWTQTLLNAVGIAMAFLLAGLLLVWIDRWRPLGSGRSSR